MRTSSLAQVWRRFCRHRLALVSLFVLLLLMLMAAFAPLIAPYPPTKVSTAFSQPPSAQHLLGTDQIGRDVFSRLLYATQVSLLVGLLATAISTAVGVVLGLVSGYFGGAVIVEKMFSWPGLGLVTMNAITGRDYPVIMGVCLLSAVVVLAANLLTDIVYALVDPTIQY